jgi:hypothetical protein
MITKGTLGFGCHRGDIGCHTSYDNIKITKYVPVLPTVSLGKFYVMGYNSHSNDSFCVMEKLEYE